MSDYVMESISETVGAVDSALKLWLCLDDKSLHSHPMFVLFLSVSELSLLSFFEVYEDDTHEEV